MDTIEAVAFCGSSNIVNALELTTQHPLLQAIKVPWVSYAKRGGHLKQFDARKCSHPAKGKNKCLADQILQCREKSPPDTLIIISVSANGYDYSSDKMPWRRFCMAYIHFLLWAKIVIDIRRIVVIEPFVRGPYRYSPPTYKDWMSQKKEFEALGRKIRHMGATYVPNKSRSFKDPNALYQINKNNQSDFIHLSKNALIELQAMLGASYLYCKNRGKFPNPIQFHVIIDHQEGCECNWCSKSREFMNQRIDESDCMEINLESPEGTMQIDASIIQNDVDMEESN